MATYGLDQQISDTKVAAEFVMHGCVGNDEGYCKLQNHMELLPCILDDPRQANIIVHEIFEVLHTKPQGIMEILDLVMCFRFLLVMGSLCIIVGKLEPSGGGFFSFVGSIVEQEYLDVEWGDG